MGKFFRRKRYTLVAMRLADMHVVHPDQVTLTCHQCHKPVGVYPSGQATLSHYRKRVDLVCQVCHGPVDGARLAPGALAEPGQSVPARRDG